MGTQTDLMLGEGNDLQIADGDLVVGGSEMQEVGLILQASPGTFRNDPVLGPALVRMINAKAQPQEIQTAVKVHLARDGKDYEQLKERIRMNYRTL